MLHHQHHSCCNMAPGHMVGVAEGGRPTPSIKRRRLLLYQHLSVQNNPQTHPALHFPGCRSGKHGSQVFKHRHTNHPSQETHLVQHTCSHSAGSQFLSPAYLGISKANRKVLEVLECLKMQLGPLCDFSGVPSLHLFHGEMKCSG